MKSFVFRSVLTFFASTVSYYLVQLAIVFGFYGLFSFFPFPEFLFPEYTFISGDDSIFMNWSILLFSDFIFISSALFLLYHYNSLFSRKSLFLFSLILSLFWTSDMWQGLEAGVYGLGDFCLDFLIL